MFETLGANTAGSVLASIATAFCLIPLILTYLGVGARGSSTSGDDDPLDGAAGSAQDFEKKEKKRKERKTVRWDDETDSDLGKGGRSEDLRGGESMDTAEMEMESKGAGVVDVEMEMENENVVSETSRVGAEKSENRRSDAEAESSKVEKEGWSRTFDSSGDDGSAGSCKRTEKGEKEKEDKKKREKKEDEKMEDEKKEDEKKEKDVKKKQEEGEKEEKGGKEKARLDDGDDGVAGLLGMDLERAAVFPYF